MIDGLSTNEYENSLPNVDNRHYQAMLRGNFNPKGSGKLVLHTARLPQGFFQPNLPLETIVITQQPEIVLSEEEKATLPKRDKLDRTKYGELSPRQIKKVDEYIFSISRKYDEPEFVSKRRSKINPETYYKFYAEAQGISSGIFEDTEAKAKLLAKHFYKFSERGKQPIWNHENGEIGKIFARTYETAEKYARD